MFDSGFYLLLFYLLDRSGDCDTYKQCNVNWLADTYIHIYVYIHIFCLFFSDPPTPGMYEKGLPRPSVWEC